MSKFSVILLVLFSFIKTQAHTNAHVHGVGDVSIAFDATQGKLEFESPADSTVGFEHNPKNLEQKKKLADTLELLKTKMNDMVIFDKDLKCAFTSKIADFEIEKDSSHASTRAHFDIVCAQSPKGSKLGLKFTHLFPKLKKVTVQILIDDLQKSVTVDQDSISVDLK